MTISPDILTTILFEQWSTAQSQKRCGLFFTTKIFLKKKKIVEGLIEASH